VEVFIKLADQADLSMYNVSKVLNVNVLNWHLMQKMV